MADMTSYAATSTSLQGVCVVYCENGKLKEEWIDLGKVGAIAWTNGDLKERPANPSHSNEKVPKGSKPTKCPETGVAGTAPVCWWNGTQWVCGEA